DACFALDSRPTHWADDAFKSLRDVCPEIVLRNLAELDWRIRTAPGADDGTQDPNPRGDGPMLLSGIWHAVEEEFREATLEKRKEWLKRVGRLAFMEPEHVWRLVEIARDHPKPADAEEVQP